MAATNDSEDLARVVTIAELNRVNAETTELLRRANLQQTQARWYVFVALVLPIVLATITGGVIGALLQRAAN